MSRLIYKCRTGPVELDANVAMFYGYCMPNIELDSLLCKGVCWRNQLRLAKVLFKGVTHVNNDVHVDTSG